MLCTGLRTSLKDISGHTFVDIKDFDALRIKLRQLEKHHERRHSVNKKHSRLEQQQHVAIHRIWRTSMDLSNSQQQGWIEGKQRERKNMLSSIKGVMVDDHTQKKISPSEKKWHPRLYSRVILFSSCDNLP